MFNDRASRPPERDSICLLMCPELVGATAGQLLRPTRDRLPDGRTTDVLVNLVTTRSCGNSQRIHATIIADANLARRSRDALPDTSYVVVDRSAGLHRPQRAVRAVPGDLRRRSRDALPHRRPADVAVDLVVAT